MLYFKILRKHVSNKINIAVKNKNGICSSRKLDAPQLFPHI